MKILFVCHRFPYPPNRGGKIRPFNIIRHLQQQKHDVTVASLVRSKDEAAAGRPLASYCSRLVSAPVSEPLQFARIFGRLLTNSPCSMGYFYSPHLARRIRQLVEDTSFDLIFVHCSSVAPYVAGVTGIPKILDFGDMDSQKWADYAESNPFPLSLGYALESRKLLAWEKRLARQFSLCTTTTLAEAETLKSFQTGAATDWFPNGVDADYFAPGDAPYDANTICFLGRMDYYPNYQAMVHFCKTTWPLVQQRIPAAKLLIIGSNPHRSVRRLASPSVTVTGFVSDIRPLARNSAVTIAPLEIARGTQNKILESLALGVPVICSSLAARGVSAVPGEHLLCADTPQEQVEAICDLMQNRERRHALAAAGRRRILEQHNWDRSMRHLDEIIDRCLQAVG